MKRINYRNAKTKPVFAPRDFKAHSRFNLQLFADDDGGDKGGEGSDSGAGEKNHAKGADGAGEQKPKTYNDDDVDRIIAKKKAEWEKQKAKELDDAREEARKYEQLSKEQKEEADRKKAQEEADKKDARIKELENQIATESLRRSVAADVEAMKEGITASTDFLDMVVTGADAKEAKAKVEKLVGIILADRKAQEEKRASGRTPKSYNSGGGDGVTDPYAAIVAKNNKR